MKIIFCIAPSHLIFKKELHDLFILKNLTSFVVANGTSFLVKRKFQFRYISSETFLRGSCGFYLIFRPELIPHNAEKDSMRMVLNARIASRDLIAWDWKILEREP